MKEQIKAGDYVYIPHYSRKALLVKINNMTLFDFYAMVDDCNHFISFDKYGYDKLRNGENSSGADLIEPIAFLATPENKAKIEQFYGCELESPPTFRMATLSIPHDNC